MFVCLFAYFVFFCLCVLLILCLALFVLFSEIKSKKNLLKQTYFYDIHYPSIHIVIVKPLLLASMKVHKHFVFL